MSGIYVHVPFCRTACHYCDFHFSTSLSRVESYVNALLKEIELRSKNQDWKNLEFHTLYFGGGTPSVLSPKSLKLITDVISDSFRFKASDQNILFGEATIEVNP